MCIIEELIFTSWHRALTKLREMIHVPCTVQDNLVGLGTPSPQDKTSLQDDPEAEMVGAAEEEPA
jgi:hypothetical protein